MKIQQVLEKYGEGLPKNLPKTLPRYIGIEHEIELLTGAKPLAKVAY